MYQPSGAAGQPPAILIVDDEPALRFALSRYFARQGWTVGEAADGQEALALLDGRVAWDVVLCDLTMPGMGGEALHDRLAATDPRWLERLVIASGDVSEAASAAFLARVVCPVLEKPFPMPELLAIATRLAGSTPAAGSQQAA